jgi:hypothetical protein
MERGLASSRASFSVWERDGMSVSNIVVGIVIAWIIIKVLERFGDLLERNADDKNEKPKE